MNPVSPFQRKEPFSDQPVARLYILEPGLEKMAIDDAKHNGLKLRVNTVEINGVKMPYNRTINIYKNQLDTIVSKSGKEDYSGYVKGEAILVGNVRMSTPCSEEMVVVSAMDYSRMKEAMVDRDNRMTM